MAAVTPAVAEYLSIDPDELARLCQEYGVIELAVFGSVARHEDTPASDVDLLYTLDPDSRLGWGIEELNDRLTEALGRPVELVSKKYLHRMLREQVLRDAVVSMRGDDLLIAEMTIAAEDAIDILGSRRPADLEADKIRRDAILWNMTVLGEAASQVSDSVKSGQPAVEWSAMASTPAPRARRRGRRRRPSCRTRPAPASSRQASRAAPRVRRHQAATPSRRRTAGRWRRAARTDHPRDVVQTGRYAS